MRYQTEVKGESTYLLGEFATGETVTIVLYDILTGNIIPLDSNTCNEIGTTGWFRWATTEITTPATSKVDYLYIMTDSKSFTYSGKITIGGYVDDVDAIKTETDKIQVIDNNVDSILTDTNELQSNQNNWTTASGFSVPHEYDTVISNIQLEVNGLHGEAMRGTNNALLVTDVRLDNLDAAISTRAVPNEYDSRLSSIQAELDNPDQYKATGFATQNPPSQNLDDYKATGFSVPGEYDAELADIKTDLDNPDQYKADVSGVGITEGDFHNYLTSYSSKDGYKADISNLEVILGIVKDILEGDMMPTETKFRILHKITKVVLVDKDTNIVGNLTQLIEP